MPPLRIFISYGRDQYAPLAARLAADLTARGYEVWYDQQLQTGQTWARLIQKKLNWVAETPANGCFIYLLTRHSTREDSFCLQEMQHALDHKVPVFPLLVEDCDIPIEIYGKQRLDFRPAWPLEKGEAAYGSLLRRLVNDLGVEPLATASPPARIKTVTPPKTISPSEPAAGSHPRAPERRHAHALCARR